MMTLRSTLIVFAIAVAAPIAAFAQAGGLPSATAPSNSEGTPSSSTGVVGATRVGPATTMASPTHARRHRHRHHRSHRHAVTSGQ